MKILTPFKSSPHTIHPEKRLFVKVIVLLALFLTPLLVTKPTYASSVWKIQTPSSHLYLVGTLHILHPTEYPLPSTFEDAYQASSIIVTEVNFDEMNNAETVLAQARHLLYPSGHTLEKHLNAKTWKKLLRTLKTYGASSAFVNQMKPSLAATTIAMMAFHAEGITSPGIDDHFFKRAKIDNKKIESLETLAAQFEAIASFDMFDPNDVIDSTLNEIADAKGVFTKMSHAWRSGDMNGLARIFTNPMKKDFPQAYKAILVNRNRDWIAKIKHYLNTPQTEMILVGTAHMAGPDGLITQLKADGFQVVQLKK